MPKLQFSGKRWSITVPTEYVEAKGWKPGMTLMVSWGANGELTYKEVE